MTSGHNSQGFGPAFWAGLALAMPWYPAPAYPTSRALRGWIGERSGRVMRTLMVWYERSRQRRAALELDHRILRDIGLNRTDVLAEAQKPFWRA